MNLPWNWSKLLWHFNPRKSWVKINMVILIFRDIFITLSPAGGLNSNIYCKILFIFFNNSIYQTSAAA
jgi:hypothetical protein